MTNPIIRKHSHYYVAENAREMIDRIYAQFDHVVPIAGYSGDWNMGASTTFVAFGGEHADNECIIFNVITENTGMTRQPQAVEAFHLYGCYFDVLYGILKEQRGE